MPMTAADLAAVVALEQRIQRHPWTLGNFADSLAADHACWVERRAGVLAAFAVIMPTVDEVQLLNIGVAPERQRTGLGRSMLEFLCERARQAGMLRMLLEVRPSNTGAIAFYQHFDFVEIGRRRGYYPDSTGREDAIVMARKLSNNL
ncbi:MAG: ribosomal protein S18-alanine N-acetyltransferase [Rhodocyclaceae bacterium]|nr:ribosomal protein S18-alanine N-acetyltransferase [Rhodocyclaceae bacterium]